MRLNRTTGELLDDEGRLFDPLARRWRPSAAAPGMNVVASSSAVQEESLISLNLKEPEA